MQFSIWLSSRRSWEKRKTDGFSLAFIQSMFLYQHIPADNLLTTFLDLDHLGFEAGDEVIKPTPTWLIAAKQKSYNM